MTTDPRIAALAAALEAVMRDSVARVGGPYAALGSPEVTIKFDRPAFAAAILAALPPDWCGHYEEIWDLTKLLDEADDKIARLRKIEEAARALITAKDAREELDSYEALCAALGSER